MNYIRNNRVFAATVIFQHGTNLKVIRQNEHISAEFVSEVLFCFWPTDGREIPSSVSFQHFPQEGQNKIGKVSCDT